MGPISAIGGNGGTGSAIGLGGTGGEFLISTPGNIALGGAINAYGGLDGAGITRTCCGLIDIVAGGAVTQAQTAALTTDSLVAAGTDVKLDLTNTVKSLQGSASNGNFTFNNSGNLELEGVSASRLASISATGNITGSRSAAGLPLAGISTSGSPLGNAVQGGTGVTLNAGGAIGSTAAPLAVAAPALAASAAYGIAIDLNAFGPTPAVVNTLTTTTGDILLNAHGGTTITRLVSSPGNVTINSFGPLDVQQGITAGSGIFLSTAGPSLGSTLPNDMTLNGPFTYSTATGAFEVTIGAFGTLHLVASGLGLTAPLFPNQLNITKFTFVSGDPLANTIVAAAYNTTAASGSLGARVVEEAPTKDKRDDKKAAAICK